MHRTTTGSAGVLADLSAGLRHRSHPRLGMAARTAARDRALVDEREPEIAAALAEDLGRSPRRRGSAMSLRARGKRLMPASM